MQDSCTEGKTNILQVLVHTKFDLEIDFFKHSKNSA